MKKNKKKKRKKEEKNKKNSTLFLYIKLNFFFLGSKIRSVDLQILINKNKKNINKLFTFISFTKTN
jgi:hypothetical protein